MVYVLVLKMGIVFEKFLFSKEFLGGARKDREQGIESIIDIGEILLESTIAIE
jgi:hypothetical protein